MEKATSVILKKEYLGRSDLFDFVIPDGVTEIGDWAFADCSNLISVSIPASVHRIGRHIFSGCKRLQRIMVRGLKNGDCLQYLLAYAFREFDFPVATNALEIGADEWVEWLDVRLLSYLQSDDADGFTPFLAGGEEDYQDVRKAREEYCMEKRVRKFGFVSERLLAAKAFPIRGAFASDFKKHLNTYIPCVDVLISMLSAVGERGLLFMELYGELGILTKEVCQTLLKLVDVQDVELRSWLLQYTKTETVWNDFCL